MSILKKAIEVISSTSIGKTVLGELGTAVVEIIPKDINKAQVLAFLALKNEVETLKEKIATIEEVLAITEGEIEEIVGSVSN